jgi:putative DNA primase/helicase
MTVSFDFEERIKKAKQKSQQQKSQREAELICASDIKIKALDWLWEGHLARGMLELLTGLPGLGKSQVQINYVACVTTGTPWPDRTAGITPANVIMLTAEDGLDQTVVPRLIAAGADLKRVHIIKCIKTDEATGKQFLLGEDLDVLEKTIAKIGNVALVTIDPITAYMGGKIDSHKATEVRSQLGPLKDFAERMNVAVAAITHPAKNTSQKAIDQFIGSQAFIAAGRIGHACIKEFDEDGDETGRVLFTHAKYNNSEQKPTLAFKVVAATIGQDEDSGLPITAPHVVWENDSVDISADEAVRAATGSGGKQRGKQEAVQTFLRMMLKGGKPVPAKDVYAEATKHGFTEEQLRTARKKMGIVIEQPKGLGGAWTWQLPIPF